MTDQVIEHPWEELEVGVRYKYRMPHWIISHEVVVERSSAGMLGIRFSESLSVTPLSDIPYAGTFIKVQSQAL